MERVANCFVVRLRFPVPEEWTIKAHGVEEKLQVYRYVYRAVEIDLTAENEMAEKLPTGNDQNMELKRNAKIDFAASYAYHGHALDISRVGSAMTATLEIQVKRPGDNARYRNLETVQMQVRGQSHRTMESVSLKKLAERENELYQEQTRSYRARIVLEWQEEETQRMYSEWFLFGTKDTAIKQLCMEPMVLGVTANGLIDLPLEQYIANDDGDPLIYELRTEDGPADQFTLADESGEPLMEADENGNTIPNACLLSDLWIKATPYVGNHTLYLHIWDGEEHCVIQIDLEVQPYPEDRPKSVPVVEVELNNVPGFLKWLFPRLAAEEGTDEYRTTMDEGVLDVCVVGKNANKVTWAYDKDTRQLVIRPKKAGLMKLGLQMTYNAFKPDGKGGYVSQICEDSVRLDVTGRFGRMIWQTVAVVIVAVLLGWIVVMCVKDQISRRRFPEGLCCTMVLQEKIDQEKTDQVKWQNVSLPLSMPIAELEPANVTLAELIDKLKDDGVEEGSGGELADLNGIREWFNENGGNLQDVQLKRIRLKGSKPNKGIYWITGLRKHNGIVEARPLGDRETSEKELTARKCKPGSKGLSISVDTTKTGKIKVHTPDTGMIKEKKIDRIQIEIEPDS